MKILLPLLIAVGLHARAQSNRTWQNNAADGDWNDAVSWSALPVAGDNLLFSSAAGAATSPNNNNFTAGTAFNSLQFLNNTFNAPLLLGGNAIALGGGVAFNSGSGAVIVNQNTTANRTVTIDNNIALSGTVQFATANSVNAVTVISGDVSGTGTLELRGHNMSPGNYTGLSSLRFSGDNSGYTGTLALRRSSDNALFEGSVYFANPGAWFSSATWAGSGSTAVRGVVQLGAGNGTYVFGLGSDAGEWNALTGSNRSILAAVGGTVVYDPGNEGGYGWDTQTSEVSLGGANLSDGGGEMHFGTSGQTLTFTGGNKSIHPERGITRVKFTLGDDGSARNFTVGSTSSLTSLGVLVLEGGNFSGNKGGTTAVAAGALSISGVNQIADGNLNLQQGVLVFNNLPSGFGLDRSYGTGANQWQISGSINENVGGGFAARGQAVTLSGGGTGDFNRDFYLGTIITEQDGQTLYANKGVTIAQNTVLTGNRSWGIAGSQTVVAETSWIATLANWQNFNSPTLAMHEVTGSITGDFDLTLRGRNSRIGGVLRLSNTGNTFNNLNIAQTTAGRVVVIATDDAVLGDGNITVYNTGNSSGAGLLLWEGTKTFTRNVAYTMTNATAGTAGMGSWSGNTVYTGTMTLNGSNQPQHQFFAQGGSTFQLGTPGDDANLTYGRGGAAITYVKGGSGTVILNNLTQTSAPASVIWQIGTGVQNNINNTVAAPYFDGAVRETGTGASNSLNGYTIILAGGVLESNGTFTRALGTTSADVRWLTGGGGFAAHGGALSVNIGTAGLTWGSTANFLTTNNPLILGSETANNTVTFQNAIALNGAVREIRVMDNAASAADKAVINGNLTGTGSSGLVKTGGGILELSGAANSYAGTTAVNAGILRVNGNLTGLGAVTVASGATLGGSGGIAGAVTVLSGGMIAPGNSIESLATGSETWNGGAFFELELSDDGSGAAGTEWDALNIAGTLDLTGVTEANPFTVRVVSMSNATTPGLLASWDPNANHTWAGFVSTSGGFVGLTDAATQFQVDDSAFQNALALNGHFKVIGNGNNLDLQYFAIPEPGTLLLLGLGFSVMFAWGRRKR